MTRQPVLEYAPPTSSDPSAAPPGRLPLVVVTLLLALVAFFFLAFSGRRIRPDHPHVASYDVARLTAALEQFHADTGRYPTDAEGLGALVGRPVGLSKWKGPYIDSIPRLDPWGRLYVYRSPPRRGVILSMGPDGGEGTADDIVSRLPP